MIFSGQRKRKTEAERKQDRKVGRKIEKEREGERERELERKKRVSDRRTLNNKSITVSNFVHHFVLVAPICRSNCVH